MALCSIVDYGAIGDGSRMNTAAFAAAVTSCGEAGGGTILVPVSSPTGNIFRTGSFSLAYDNLELRVEKGATLLGSAEEADYPLVPPLPSYGVGRDIPSAMRYRALITASNVSNVSLTAGGTIDGHGGPWWARYFSRRLKWSRPRLVEFMFCRQVLVQDLTLQNSAFWTVHPYASDDVVVQRVVVSAPAWAPNTDGVDPDSCRNVLIRDCIFRAGDDGVAIKSGLNAAGREFGRPSENVRVQNVTVEPAFDNGSTNGVSIGSEMSGGVHNISVEGLVVRRCAVGVYVKSMEGRGGLVSNVAFRNVFMDRVVEPIRFAMNYSYDLRDPQQAGVSQRHQSPMRSPMHSDSPMRSMQPANSSPPRFANLSVTNLTANHARVAGVFAGLADSTIDGVRLVDLRIDAPKPFVCRYVRGEAIRTEPPACFTAGL